MEIAVVREGEDKYCNHPRVILAESASELESKVSRFLLAEMGDHDVRIIMQAQNAANEPDPDNYPDEEAFDAAYEAWKDYEPSDEAVAKFRTAEHDGASILELYRDEVGQASNPWEIWHVHTTMDNDAYSSVTVITE